MTREISDARQIAEDLRQAKERGRQMRLILAQLQLQQEQLLKLIAEARALVDRKSDFDGAPDYVSRHS